MFKRLLIGLIAIVSVFGLVAWAAPQRCLPPGEYAIAIGNGADIYTMTMHGTKLAEVNKTTFPVRGIPAWGLAADSCRIYIPWIRSGQVVSHIWSTGYNGTTAHQVTFSQNPHEGEIQPVFSEREGKIAFTILGVDGTKVGTNFQGSGYYDKVVADSAFAPAWDPSNGGLSYTDIVTGKINPWNYTGTGTYLPDGSGVLVQNGNEFTLYPILFAGVPQHFVTARAVAIGPHIAAIIRTDGTLVFQALDANWMPVGNPTPGPNFPNLQSVVWLTVPPK